MPEVDFEALRQRVLAAKRVSPSSGDAAFDELATSSLVAAYNRLVPHDFALPSTGRIALEVSAHSGSRLDAHAHSLLEGAVARAIALVGASIMHPDADVQRLRDRAYHDVVVFSRPTQTGAISFLPDRQPVLPGTEEDQTVAERAMSRLARILPADPADLSAADRLLGLRQPERRAVGAMAEAARSVSGVSLLLLGADDVVRSTVTSSQADDIRDLLGDSETRSEVLPPVVGRLDGMRFSRQMFFLQIEGGRDRQGIIDVDLVPKAKALLDQRVRATLERVVTLRADGGKGRPAYRLIDVEAAGPEPGLFERA